MTREEAIAILEVSKHMATSGRMYNQAIDMAIEALQREEAEAKGYCHRIKPKEYFKKDAMQKLREMPRHLNGVKEKQITKISADGEQKWGCTANFVAEQLNKVVRCKDCKYSFYDKDYESYNCRKHEYVELFDADDYCSWGERND